MAQQLYHFTCDHGRRGIGTGANCLLLPHLHPWLGVKLLWLTSQPGPARVSVGLTSRMLKCDRMAYRYTVTDTAKCRRWLDSPERASLSPELLQAFEYDDDDNGGDVRPDTWWITQQPVRAVFDKTYLRSRGGLETHPEETTP